MNMNRKIIVAIALVAVIVTSVVAYVYYYVPIMEEESEWEDWENTLVIGGTHEIENIDPHLGWVGLDHYIRPLIADNLWWSPWDEPGVVKGQLAESYEVKYELIDGDMLPYIDVGLREGLHWNDGTEIVASDVVFSNRRHLEKDIGRLGTFKWIYNYERFGDDTWVELSKYHVKIRVKTAFPLVVLALCGGSTQTTVIMSESAADEYGEGFDVAKYGTSGPLVLKEYVADEKIVLEVREDYKDPAVGGWVEGMGKADEVWPPKWKTLVIRLYADSATLAMALKMGDIDISVGDHSLQEIKELQADPNIEVQAMPGGCNRYLAINFGFPPLDDIRVRQAIAYALDPSVNVETVKLGLAAPAYSVVHPNYDYYTPAFQDKYGLHGSTDLEKARALLAEAGYSEGFEIDYVQAGHYGSEEEEQMDALIIQEQLAKIGITVNIQMVDSGTWKTLRTEGKIAMFMPGFYPDFPGPSNDIEILSQHGYQIHLFDLMENETKYPESVYRVQEFMDLVEEGQDLWDPSIPAAENTERAANYIKQQELIADCVYTIPYYFTQGFLCSRTYVKNLHQHWFMRNWDTPGILAAYKERPVTAQMSTFSGLSTLCLMPLLCQLVCEKKLLRRRWSLA